jgi:hypothetical protein
VCKREEGRERRRERLSGVRRPLHGLPTPIFPLSTFFYREKGDGVVYLAVVISVCVCVCVEMKGEKGVERGSSFVSSLSLSPFLLSLSLSLCVFSILYKISLFFVALLLSLFPSLFP